MKKNWDICKKSISVKIQYPKSGFIQKRLVCILLAMSHDLADAIQIPIRYQDHSEIPYIVGSRGASQLGGIF